MPQKLSSLKVGTKALILTIESSIDKKIKQRLRDMGIVKGEEVFIKKFAPLGDPIEVVIKGYSLTLRKKEADLINVEINL